MKGKEKVIFYRDWSPIFEALSDEQAGQLVKHIMRYIDDQQPPEPSDPVVRMAWLPMQIRLKKDLTKWVAMVERNRQNSGAATSGTQSDPVGPSGSKPTPVAPDKDKDKDKDKEEQGVPGIGFEHLIGFKIGSKKVADAFHAFLEHRHNLGKPMTVRGVELLWRELNKLSTKAEHQVRLLENAQVKGWSMVYPMESEGPARSKAEETAEIKSSNRVKI